MAVSGNLGKKVPVVDNDFSTREQEKYPITSFDGNCKVFELITDRCTCFDLRQTFLTLKLKFVKDRVYITNKSKDAKKEHLEDTTLVAEDEETKEEGNAAVPLVTHVNNILHSCFFHC